MKCNFFLNTLVVHLYDLWRHNIIVEAALELLEVLKKIILDFKPQTGEYH